MNYTQPKVAVHRVNATTVSLSAQKLLYKKALSFFRRGLDLARFRERFYEK
jgi:hypothetical protein